MAGLSTSEPGRSRAKPLNKIPSKLRQRTTTSTDTPPRAGYNVALYSTGLSSTPGFQTSGTGRHSGISFST